MGELTQKEIMNGVKTIACEVHIPRLEEESDEEYTRKKEYYISQGFYSIGNYLCKDKEVPVTITETEETKKDIFGFNQERVKLEVILISKETLNKLVRYYLSGGTYEDETSIVYPRPIIEDFINKREREHFTTELG